MSWKDRAIEPPPARPLRVLVVDNNVDAADSAAIDLKKVQELLAAMPEQPRE